MGRGPEPRPRQVSSNGTWGDVVEHEPLLGEVWDGYARLPDPGENPALDAFVERKHITHASLVRQGARLPDPNGPVIAFAYSDGLKFRNMVTGQRWSYEGSTFPRLKIVRSADQADTVIVCEGETDGAWLSDAYPACDIAILPAGARYFPASYAAQLSPYARLLVGLDNDDAGRDGFTKIAAALPHAQRFTPPEGANDWCELDSVPDLPAPEEAPPRVDVVVWGSELRELEVPEIASWYEQAILPIGGQMMIHGWAKALKSFVMLDLMSALAQGQDWLGFEPTEEPCRVCVVQFEITWPYYQERVLRMREKARLPELWDQNFGTYSPLARPRFTAGNKQDEDTLLKALVDNNVQVVGFDPVRRAVGGADMNAENEVRKILAFFERIQDEGITVVATHHDNKEGARNRTGSTLSMTGSGAFAGDCDTALSITTPSGVTEQEPKRNVSFTVRNAPSPSARGFELVDGVIVVNPTPWGLEPDEPLEGEPEI